VSRQPDLSREQGLWARGYARIAGLDEAGRGAWAGPVVAAAVILPYNHPETTTTLSSVRDSKLLSPRQREACYELIVRHALAYGVGWATADEIDRIGIVPATRLAMSQAIQSLAMSPDHLLIDALPLPDIAIPQWAMPKGDRDCLSIAAASIIAKVSRDHWMIALDAQTPGYGLAQHKGYGTRQHLACLRQIGPSAQHRRSFAPIRSLLEGGADV